MKNFSKLKIMACIYASSNPDITHNLIYKIKSEYPTIFDRILIIDIINDSPNQRIYRTLKVNDIDYEYQNINGLGQTDRGYLFKTAMMYAYENSFDFIVEFNEGWVDSYDKVMNLLSRKELTNKTIICATRKPIDLNPGRVFNFLSNIFSSISLKNIIKDFKGDSINVYRVNNFISKFYDALYKLSDDDTYFWDVLSLCSYHNYNIQFTDAVDLNTPSLIKLNTKRFLQTLQKNIITLFFNRYYVNKNKSTINPRTIKVSKSLSQISDNIYSNVNTLEDFKTSEPINKEEYKINSSEDTSLSEQEIETTDLNHQEIKVDYNFPLMSSKDVDPDAKIMRLDHIDPKNRDIIVVNWCLTNICNFKCSYCPEDLHNGTHKGASLEDIKRFYEAIETYHPDKDLFFEFTGGEVTYYKQFPELIRYIKQKGGYVGLISNGNRKITYWQEHHEFIDHICLSFHSEQADPHHFHEVCSFMTQKASTHVNIMMKPEKFDICYQLAQDIASDTRVSISMQPLLENMDGELYHYTKYQKSIMDTQALYYTKEPKYERLENFRDYIYRGSMRATLSNNTSTYYTPPEFISREWNRWEGWECYTGVENIIVDYNGDIFRGWCKIGGKIGNVSDDQFNLPTKPIICTKSQCSCGLDIMTTKVRV